MIERKASAFIHLKNTADAKKKRGKALKWDRKKIIMKILLNTKVSEAKSMACIKGHRRSTF